MEADIGRGHWKRATRPSPTRTLGEERETMRRGLSASVSKAAGSSNKMKTKKGLMMEPGPRGKSQWSCGRLHTPQRKGLGSNLWPGN